MDEKDTAEDRMSERLVATTVKPAYPAKTIKETSLSSVGGCHLVNCKASLSEKKRKIGDVW